MQTFAHSEVDAFIGEFACDNRSIIVWCSDQSAQRITIGASRNGKEVLFRHAHPMHRMALSPVAEMVAYSELGAGVHISESGESFCVSGHVRLISMSDGSTIAETWAARRTLDLRFSPEGRRLWVVSDRGLTLWPCFFDFRITNIVPGTPIVTSWQGDGVHALCPFCTMLAARLHGKESCFPGPRWHNTLCTFPSDTLGKNFKCGRCSNVFRLSSRVLERQPIWWEQRERI